MSYFIQMPLTTATQPSPKRTIHYVGLETISAPVKPHLADLERFMRGQVNDFERETRELVAYCLKNSGKRIRPILLFYSGWTSPNTISGDLVKAAAVIELVHLATLVHDDILDEASLRHNESTVSEKFGPGIAVLLGDALFSQALKLASEFPNVDVCRSVSKATRRVCAGEIGQSFQRGNTALEVEDYYRIINYKTAELFYVSCHLGAKLADYPEEFISAVGNFGRRLGVAYQIFDDIADFIGQEARIGKTLGTDVASGKFTLPLILLLRKLNKMEGKELVRGFKNGKPADIKGLNRLMAEKGIFDQVCQCFMREIDAAEEALAPFGDYPPVDHLKGISSYVRAQVSKFVWP